MTAISTAWMAAGDELWLLNPANPGDESGSFERGAATYWPAGLTQPHGLTSHDGNLYCAGRDFTAQSLASGTRRTRVTSPVRSVRSVICRWRRGPSNWPGLARRQSLLRGEHRKQALAVLNPANPGDESGAFGEVGDLAGRRGYPSLGLTSHLRPSQGRLSSPASAGTCETGREGREGTKGGTGVPSLARWPVGAKDGLRL